MWTTARNLRQRLSVALLLAATYGLTVGNGFLPAVIIMMGECPTGGSTGCS